jgi:hypothetical protein
MVAFEILINGKRRGIAGHRDARLLTVWLNGHVPELAGVPTALGIHAAVAIPAGPDGQLETLSYPYDALSVGDEVLIRIVDVDKADEPRKQDHTLGSIEFTATS